MWSPARIFAAPRGVSMLQVQKAQEIALGTERTPRENLGVLVALNDDILVTIWMKPALG